MQLRCPCGTIFPIKPCLVKNGAKYCSKKCQNLYNLTKFKKGNSHPFFRTGTYVTDNQVRRSFKYISWQKQVYKRDDYTCQICGSRGENLRANHIKRFADFPELRYEITNGVVICSPCDYLWVLRREEEWESYFNFNLMTRGHN